MWCDRSDRLVFRFEDQHNIMSNPKVSLMEKRIGAALIVVENRSAVELLNSLISKHSHIILGRQGLPLADRAISVISLVLEGTTDDIGAFTGPVGRLPGVTIKSILLPATPNSNPNRSNS